MLCLFSAGVLYPAVSSLLFPSRPKDAMRALKKRLCGNKNYREVMLALTVRTFSCFFLIVKLTSDSPETSVGIRWQFLWFCVCGSHLKITPCIKPDLSRPCIVSWSFYSSMSLLSSWPLSALIVWYCSSFILFLAAMPLELRSHPPTSLIAPLVKSPSVRWNHLDWEVVLFSAASHKPSSSPVFNSPGFCLCLIVSLSPQVLETCVKNCGHRFHIQVANRDFIDGVLVKIISPKNNPPTIVQDKVLSLIQVLGLFVYLFLLV